MYIIQCMDELTFGGKKYISSKQAAKITGYAKDYVGQLCREGRVKARLVGRSWYVLEESIREHRFGGVEVPKHNVIKKSNISKKSVIGNIRYTSEEVVSLHEISDESQKPCNNAQEDRRMLHGVSMMQEVWHDWFSTSKPSEDIDSTSNGVVDLRDEESRPVPDNTIEINVESSNILTNSIDVEKSVPNNHDSHIGAIDGFEQNVIHNSLPTEGEISHIRHSFKTKIGTQSVESDVRGWGKLFNQCIDVFSFKCYRLVSISNFILITISIVLLLTVITSILTGQARHRSDGLFWSSINYVSGITKFINI